MIALDGPAASGKSTVGLGAARQLGFAYVDTGLLYRALTALALDRGVDITNEDALVALAGRLRPAIDEHGRLVLDGQDPGGRLQQPDVDANISVVSAHPAVRAALVPLQQGLIRAPGVVLAGRDIGTVIVPDAPLKVWLSASIEERARRRAAQTGEPLADVLERMRWRDRLDGSRSAAPMARASDAVEVDTDGVPPEAIITRIVSLARQRLQP